MARERINIEVGQVFGRLTVLEDHGPSVTCRCECGRQKTLIKGNLIHNTRSCGCLKKETARERARLNIGKSHQEKWIPVLRKIEDL